MNFKEEIQSVINKHSIDHNGNLSDYYLSQLIIGYLEAAAADSVDANGVQNELESEVKKEEDVIISVYLKVKSLQRICASDELISNRLHGIRSAIAHISNNYTLIKKEHNGK